MNSTDLLALVRTQDGSNCPAGSLDALLEIYDFSPPCLSLLVIFTVQITIIVIVCNYLANYSIRII